MNKIITFLTILYMGFALASCTKTEDLDPLPQDKILEYSVNNVPAGVSLYGAIDQNEKTITLYVPFYFSMDLIDADIKVSPGAKLKDEVLPVSIDAEEQTYTVIAADGSQNTYTLHIVQQNTPPLELIWSRDPAVINPNGNLTGIYGNFYSNNPTLVTVTLIAQESKKEVVLNSRAERVYLQPRSIEDGYPYEFFGLPIPYDVEPGLHDVRIDFLGQQVYMPEPVRLEYKEPRITFGFSVQDVKQGGEIDFGLPSLSTVFVNPKSFTITIADKVYDFAIVDYDLQNITLKVPDDFPLGNPGSAYSMRAEFEGWPARNVNIRLNVSAK